MKPEDQVGFLEACKDLSIKSAGKDLGEYFFNAGMAHRDAQPAAAVNEQLLHAARRAVLALAFASDYLKSDTLHDDYLALSKAIEAVFERPQGTDSKTLKSAKEHGL